MNYRWVVNASPIIVLSAIDHADLLLRLADLIIPRSVVEEIQVGPDDSRARMWMKSRAARFAVVDLQIDSSVASWDLGSGESAVISYAVVHRSYEAIVDDRAARLCATSIGVRVRGTLGVLLLAKQVGLLPKVAPAIDALLGSGFRVAARLRENVLRLAGEM